MKYSTNKCQQSLTAHSLAQLCLLWMLATKSSTFSPWTFHSKTAAGFKGFECFFDCVSALISAGAVIHWNKTVSAGIWEIKNACGVVVFPYFSPPFRRVCVCRPMVVSSLYPLALLQISAPPKAHPDLTIIFHWDRNRWLLIFFLIQNAWKVAYFKVVTMSVMTLPLTLTTLSDVTFQYPFGI